MIRTNKAGLNLIRCLCLVLLLVYNHDTSATEGTDTESNAPCMKIEEAVLGFSRDFSYYMDGPTSSYHYCAYLTLSQKIESVGFIMYLYKKTTSDTAKLYLLKWLWDHDRNTYKKAKKLINRDTMVFVFPTRQPEPMLMAIVPVWVILKKIEDGVEIDARSLVDSMTEADLRAGRPDIKLYP